MNPTIEIFRAGKHTAMSGESIPFSENDLDGMANAYDPALHEAPVVVGHPQTDQPAYGWVKGVSRQGDRLNAQVGQIDPSFAEMVRAGRYKKISASFYKPDSSANPAPGSFYLRHVGFLGAQPPSVKGLAPVELQEAAEGTVTVEFGEAGGDERSALQQFGDWLRQTFGKGAADHVLNASAFGEDGAGSGSAEFGETRLGARLRKLRDEKGLTNADLGRAMGIDESTVSGILSGSIQRPPDERLRGAADLLGVSFEGLRQLIPEDRRGDDFAEEQSMNTKTSAGESLEERERRIQQKEAEFAERERRQRREANQAALAKMVQQGTPLPCNQERLLAFMDQLAESGAVQFSEGESKDPLKFFTDEVLGGMPKQVDYGEKAPRDDSDTEVDTADSVARAAVQYQEEMRQKGIVVSTSEAVAHVQQQKGA